LPEFKLYRRHNCTADHRTYKTLAKCIWPRALWIDGEGSYAVLSRCEHGPHSVPCLTVTLWTDPDEARLAKSEIDATGCGGRCARQHEIIELER
jgi:hypothetical protein